MAKRDDATLLDAMADHVLVHGLNTASLRPLAKAAGTSDRMLIYRFGSKDQLIAALLDHLAARMADGLSQVMPSEPAESFADCIGDIVELLRSDGFTPYLRVWLDIVSAAAQGNAAHLASGKQIIEGFLDWITYRLPAGTKDRDAAARLALTLVEGTIVMDAVGQSGAADAGLRCLRDGIKAKAWI